MSVQIRGQSDLAGFTVSCGGSLRPGGTKREGVEPHGEIRAGLREISGPEDI